MSTRSAVRGCALLLLCASASDAIVMRHDRSDTAYRDHGKTFSAVGNFGKTGSGTLIAPRAVLTAAHVARAVKASGAGFAVGGRTLAVTAVALHPAWQEGGAHDVAVVLLAEASTATPIPPCATEPSPGQALTLAGWGDAKVGRTDERAAPAADDTLALRAARNVLTRIDGDWLVFTFDAPPEGEELEGISAAGDSGGPALAEGPPVCVAGVSVWGDGHGKGPGSYGSDDGYARVVPDRAWILEQINREQVETSSPLPPGEGRKD